jgi:hypothetical protein
MSARAKPKNKSPAVRKELTLNAPDEESGRREYAKLMSSPELASARVIIATEGSQGPGANLDTPALVERLRGQATAIQSGDGALIESMLMNQAVSLQSLFAKLIERGMRSELMAHYEAHLRLALRAQAQCTRTLEVLAAIKNPPVVFAKQANIAQQQQVNNNLAPRAREVENTPTQLSADSHHELLPDPGASPLARRIDPPVATVEALDRAEDARG